MAPSLISPASVARLTAMVAILALGACAGVEDLPTASARPDAVEPLYRIGPNDTLDVFVWRNPDLSTSVPVRPDGRISMPLIEDMMAAGKTPTELSREIEENLAQFIQDPLVTVIVTGFIGNYTEQVRVVGEATNPRAIPYRANMTLLDVMIEVGGLTEFAAGNRATLVRSVAGEQKQYRVRLGDLIKDGDITANADLLPGDVIIIPESFF
ncbi:MAG: XrtA/PEP-CTERM system exopolysaccharide export protein [Kiloniellaceae bacterium]